MKSVIFALILCVFFNSEAASVQDYQLRGYSYETAVYLSNIDAEKEVKDEESYQTKYHYFVPRDAWRFGWADLKTPEGMKEMEMTNYAKGPGWEQFFGEVADIWPKGIVVKGWHGRPLDYTNGSTEEFFVQNFPYHVSKGQPLPKGAFYCARFHGRFDQWRLLDYEKVCSPPQITNGILSTNGAITKITPLTMTNSAAAVSQKSPP